MATKTRTKPAPTTNSSGNGQAQLKRDQFFANLVSNAIMSRAQLMQSLVDPRRDYDAECGYPSTSNITAEKYREMYDREPVAARVVQLMPTESWTINPTVYEDEDEDAVTDFEEAWDSLAQSLRGKSWHRGEEGNPVWEHLKRVDVLSGIGSFGVLLLGLDDGLDLSQPVQGVQEKNSAPVGKGSDGQPVTTQATGNYELIGNQAAKPRKLLFMRSFDESLVDVSQYETNPTSPRYGMPVMYSITFNDPADQSQGGIGMPLATKSVHWTRVIHVADNLGSSETFGVPRMRPVFNRLCDLRKLYGGSAEMYWRGAFPGLSIETHPTLGSDVTMDTSGWREQLEQYTNGLQRYLALTGVSAKTLAPQVSDPSAQINTQLEAICIQLAVPKRIFVGSERGELASSQDEGAWNDRLRDRQNGYVTPRIIIPFVDRLILVGVLPEPEEYTVVWPDLEGLSEQEQATLAVTRTQAVAAYIQGGVESLIVPKDYLTRVLGMTREEAEEILLAKQEEIVEEDSGGSPLLGMVGGITGMTELFKQLKEGVISEETLKQQIMLFFKVDEAKAEAIIADGLPEQPEPPPAPIKVREGEKLVNPDGAPLPSANVYCPTGEGGGVDPSCPLGGKISTGKPLDRKAAAALAKKLVNLHNSAAEEYKAAFAKVGARMWGDDDAQPLKPGDERGIMKAVASVPLGEVSKIYSIETPLTVLDSYPQVTKAQRRSLILKVREIHEKYQQQWMAAIGEP